ncbi:uncharacterized protein LOC109503682 [Harpegnathos saltator]|uniref:Uncharacterized protein n=1 Tax=Harpegnathos saltator TaxID=610380 RepID=E2BD07_HARSA|nr:uncharacterized protein LOC109503682 [Harpegnathos saltator]EFN86432.1 hypothetical protein EAI_05270 [Harpegnathos saltator]
MYIDDNAEIVPRDFIVCEFYGVETCFCWNVNHSKLVMFPYMADDSSARNVRVFTTPAPVRQVQCFDGRVFVLCAPRGVYKLARGGVFAVLSKNALGMGAEFYEVLVPKENHIKLSNKQSKDSRSLFKYPTASNTTEEVHSLPLIPANTEERFLECFTDDQQEKRNICVIGYGRKLFVWTGNSVHLIYADIAGIISRIMPVMRGNKIAGVLLLVNMDTVILMHSRDCNLVFQKIWLGRNIRCTSTLCASFCTESEDILWIVYCDLSKLYYMRKELSTDNVEEAKIEQKTFTCMQYYKSNIILGLLDNRELIELSVETLKNSLSINNSVELRADMFQNTNLIMERICDKVKELDKLYEKLTDEQDKLRKINMYAYNKKLEANPQIEICRLWNCTYLTLNIPEKLPKNSYVVFTLNIDYQSTFCMKKVTETTFTVKMPVNERKALCSSTVNMDMITLVNKEIPWCIIQNFITCPPQKEARKRSKKEQDKIDFIETKIALLRSLIEKGLDMTKLSEIKKTVRKKLKS